MQIMAWSGLDCSSGGKVLICLGGLGATRERANTTWKRILCRDLGAQLCRFGTKSVLFDASCSFERVLLNPLQSFFDLFVDVVCIW